jgi:phytol kinase
MFKVVLTLFGIFLVVILSEHLWKKRQLRGEAARKLVHITGGIFASLWPLYMSWWEIRTVSMIALVLALVMRQTNLFRGVYDIDRKSWGEVIGPVVMIGLTFLNLDQWVFATAVLHVALADGLAALIGTKYGKANRYKVFGHTKSLVGSATFWLTSCLILFWLVAFSPLSLAAAMPIILFLPTAATLTENISPFGSDNFTVPLLVILVLNQLIVF